MTRPRPSVAFALALSFLWISGACAADCPPADATLAGHYYLRGVD